MSAKEWALAPVSETVQELAPVQVQASETVLGLVQVQASEPASAQAKASELGTALG